VGSRTTEIIQITPVQQGQARRAADGSGHVIGVIVSKLNALGVMPLQPARMAKPGIGEGIEMPTSPRVAAMGATVAAVAAHDLMLDEAAETTPSPLPRVICTTTGGGENLP
jgi:hypothetical protein